jgi:hypothetical protein
MTVALPSIIPLYFNGDSLRRVINRSAGSKRMSLFEFKMYDTPSEVNLSKPEHISLIQHACMLALLLLNAECYLF